LILAVIVAIVALALALPAAADPDTGTFTPANCSGEQSAFYAKEPYEWAPGYGRDEYAHDYNNARKTWLGFNMQAYQSATDCNQEERIPPPHNPYD